MRRPNKVLLARHLGHGRISLKFGFWAGLKMGFGGGGAAAIFEALSCVIPLSACVFGLCLTAAAECFVRVGRIIGLVYLRDGYSYSTK